MLTIAACGAYRFPSGSASTGTVSGTVMMYPCGPVEQQDQPCKGMPASGLELVFTNASGSEQTARTDTRGAYSTTLDEGDWQVSLKGIARIISGPQSVTVTAGGSVVADYLVDSGIRAPAPQPNA